MASTPWVILLGLGLVVWYALASLVTPAKTQLPNVLRRFCVPLFFGLWLLFLWQMLVTGLSIPEVLLPAPTLIGQTLLSNGPTLWADFQQTFIKASLSGFALGSGSGLLIAIAVDRNDFLRRGLLPLGNFVSALPIVGIAPIMVMWFGFDWQSKSAVVTVMTFFPMLTGATIGLATAPRDQLDLMRSYGASYLQVLLRLRLFHAMPFIFNALKINATLSLIGAIVAEFFGTPIVGMGFRISAEIGRLNMDMIWATIAVAAATGSAFYGLLALVERRMTFWHPSIRQG
ncbi:MAG: ABC transporter permease [Pseudomonadota bacterium]